MFFLNHLCCRVPHNSIGARRYNIFLDSSSKSQFPFRSVPSEPGWMIPPKPRNFQNSQTSRWSLPGFCRRSELIFGQVSGILYIFRLLVSVRPPLTIARPPHPLRSQEKSGKSMDPGAAQPEPGATRKIKKCAIDKQNVSPSSDGVVGTSAA